MRRDSSSHDAGSSLIRARCVLSDLTALPMETAIGRADCRCCTTELTHWVSACAYLASGGAEISDDHLQRVKKRDATRATARDGAVGVMRGETSDGGMRGAGGRRQQRLTNRGRVRTGGIERTKVREMIREATAGTRLGARGRRRVSRALRFLRLARRRLVGGGRAGAIRRGRGRCSPPRFEDAWTSGFPPPRLLSPRFSDSRTFSPPSPLSAPPVARVAPRG